MTDQVDECSAVVDVQEQLHSGSQRHGLTDISECLEKQSVKSEAGSLTTAIDLGSPPDFLNKRFESWKTNNRTYMIPPVFGKPRDMHCIGLTDSDGLTFPDTGKKAEYEVYELLRQLGESRGIGMFVFSGFEFQDVTKWKGVHESVPDPPASVGECDFIIFHHTLGVISMEVKSTESNSTSNVEKIVKKMKEAQEQLTLSQDLVMKLCSEPNSENGQIFKVFHKKVIALPSTPKSIYSNNPADFTNLESDDHCLLFAEDTKDLEAFEKWWLRTIEAPSSDRTTRIALQQLQHPSTEAYERALSYMIMIRHISTVTDNDCINELHQSLKSYKFHGRRPTNPISETEFPSLCEFLSKMTVDVTRAEKINKEFEDAKLMKALRTKHKLKSNTDIVGSRGKKLWNALLQRGERFIPGESAEVNKMDEVVACLFFKTYLIFTQPILDHFAKMRKVSFPSDKLRLQSQLEIFPFAKMESLVQLNKLGQHLQLQNSKGKFIAGGNNPTEIDQYVFESLIRRMRIEYTRLPIVMTTEQLVVFKGPKKQLIIGPPGSGKTELLKCKAKELENEILSKKLHTKILFILGNGSADPKFQESLIFHKLRDFFSRAAPVVDVIAISLEEEHEATLEAVKKDLRNKVASGKYGHVFIDEYWIGYKPPEHEVILEIIEGIKGYVWITSVFDYNEQLMSESKRLQLRTKPLIDTIVKNGGKINRITQAARGTNCIITLERGYSQLYQSRSYPYGTNTILGHSLEGVPVHWSVVETVDLMYTRCVEFVYSATREFLAFGESLKKYSLTSSDVLIVDFAIRTSESWNTEPLYDRLKKKNIPVFDLERESALEEPVNKVTLLSSISRDASSYLDGTEWPMVIVILPSGLVRGDPSVSIAESRGAQELRNYDPYISFFRSMVQLIVISDKWTNNESFLADVKYKLSKR